jgi:hypothetical protein
LITTSPSGDDVKDAYDSAYWGGLGQEYSGIGGIGISGKLYPRDRFRDADLVTVQPFARLGVMYIPFIWTYSTKGKDAAKGAVDDETATETQKAMAAEDYDGFNNLAINVGGGVDFMLAKFFSLGVEARLWKPFVVGDTINGYKTDDYKKSDFEGSLLYNVGLNATFQW